MYFIINNKRPKIDYVFTLWGFFMHGVFLWGVLDVNFHSPIIQGLRPVPLPPGAPAKRVCLFVADGLRFRTFVKNMPPYLRSIVTGQGIWGISHTRVPTESRPGNIAIVAGLYEDPSAIFKGWKENPVDFDSVLNESRISWAWGSPDIISIFTKDGRSNIHGESYSSNYQDFHESSIRLDSWVFDRFSQWFNNEAPKIVNEDKIFLYFHLLGCDTAGHASKPKSSEYIANMRYVDEKIEEVVQLMEKYFGPGTTSYIFTSDHGMTDWGSHGSGSIDETETPFVVWGAGLRNDSQVKNIEQADIAPLISALLGTPIPVNNEGILPREFMNGNTEYEARAFLSNVKQLALQVKANRMLTIGKSLASFSKQEEELFKKINAAEHLLNEGRLSASLKTSEDAILVAKDALSYFRGYYRSLYSSCLTIMWLGWIALLYFKATGKRRDNVKFFWTFLNDAVFLVFLVVLFYKHNVSGYQDFRWLGYGGIALSSFCLAFRCIITTSPRNNSRDKSNFQVSLLGIACLIATMYYGLKYRWFLSIGMLLTTIMQRVFLKEGHYLLPWTGITLAIFPLLPVVEPQPRIYIVLTSIVIAGLACYKNGNLKSSLKIAVYCRLILTALICMEFINGRLWLSWVILGSTPFFIWMHPTDVKDRIEGIVFSTICPLALLSASYESLFYLVLASHLLCWPLPKSLKDKSESFAERLTLQDLVRASFLMLYTLLCFFGTGNMASISSFDPSWTRNFVTVFSPFTMTGLILLKTVVPLILVGCVCRALASKTTFLGVLLLGDCLALFLMHGVTSHGSWLDIGSAISRFTIAIVLPCLLLLQYYLSFPLMVFNYERFTKKESEKHHLV